MKVHRPLIALGPDRNDVYCRFDVVSKADRVMLNESFRGVPLRLDQWKPFRIMRSPSTPENLTRPLGDRAGIDFAFDPLVLSRRALDVLLPHIGAFGQVLPLSFEEAEYSFFHVTHFVDALDPAKSELVRYADGRLSRIKRHVFAADRLLDAWIFTIPQRPGESFVTDRFVQVCLEAGLTGFDFATLWSDESAVQPA